METNKTLNATPVIPQMVRWFINNVSFKWGNRILNRLPKNIRATRAKVNYRDAIFNVNTGEEIGRRLFYHGTYEPLQEAAFLSLIQMGTKIFDIGANLGIYSILAAKAGAQVHSFEPSRRVHQYLAENVKANGLSSVITLHQLAVTDSPKQLSFFEGREGNWGVGKVFKFGTSQENLETYIVNADSLPNLVRKFGQPDLIKIDIEGAEWLVIQGAKEILMKAEAPNLLLEIHPGEIVTLGGSAESLVRQIIDYGYQQYNVTDVIGKNNHLWHLFSKANISNKHFTRAQ
ncbi:MAG: FkbM family methyltransferase [Pseudomonadota bacterium]|nr:FkbM family methyltransferase [Pseudomonadota bacterium]